MARPCAARHPQPLYNGCRICYLYRTRGDYRNLWDGQPGLPRRVATNTPETRLPACVHLGVATGETKQCGSCTRTTKVKLHACAVHGVCSPVLPVAGIAACNGCTDRLVDFSVRDLAYHVCPVMGNGVWQRNVEQLRKRWRLFTGRKLITIVTGGPVKQDDGPGFLEPPGVVEKEFPDDAEFIHWRNDPHLREAGTLPIMLDRLQTEDPNRALFFGHAKGVTRPVNAGVTVHTWADLLYESLLDHWPVVRKVLSERPIAGTFKKVGRGFSGSASSWHYSGSFFWARSANLFARNWRRIDRQWWGVESYPGIHYTPDEAGVVFYEGRVPELNMYSWPYLRGKVLPAWQKWLEVNKDRRTQ